MPYIKLWVCLHAGKYAYPQLCGIFEADVTVSIPTPCSADAAHGVTEMRPLRGQYGKTLSANLALSLQKIAAKPHNMRNNLEKTAEKLKNGLFRDNKPSVCAR